MPPPSPRTSGAAASADDQKPCGGVKRRLSEAEIKPPTTNQRFSVMCPPRSNLRSKGKPSLQLDGEPGRRARHLIVSDDFTALEDVTSRYLLQRCESSCSIGSVMVEIDAAGSVPNAIEIFDGSSDPRVDRPCETPPCAPEAFEALALASKCLAPKKQRRPPHLLNTAVTATMLQF